MKEPDKLVLRRLREMRADMDRRFGAAESDIAEPKRRLESVRQATIGESVLGRYTVAEVDEQLAAIRQRLDALETRRWAPEQ